MRRHRDDTRRSGGPFVAAYARVASADLAGWAVGLTRPAYIRGLPTTACMQLFTFTGAMSTRPLSRYHCSRPTVC